MPTYEYECKSCSHSFEVFQSMSDSPLTSCPECGSEVRRLIFGGAGVIFKGSGFYVTDKSKAGSSGGEKKKAPVSSSSDACAGCPAKSDSCPAVEASKSSSSESKAESKSA